MAIRASAIIINVIRHHRIKYAIMISEIISPGRTVITRIIIAALSILIIPL